MKTVRSFNEAAALLSRRSGFVPPEPAGRLKERLQSLFGTTDPAAAVRQIIQDVQTRGDAAILDYTASLDHVELSSIEVPASEIAAAPGRVSAKMLTALEVSSQQVKRFHERQRQALLVGAEKMKPGTVMRVLERAGLYIPGGTASYPSTVLMTAIPARVAGVKEVVVTTPPGQDGHVPYITLAAASMAGVDRVFAIGGAQAIAAMAYGTPSVPRVDKICGPGNLFVMLAKRQVFGAVDIDGLQGPSEVVIIADGLANPHWCAADLLAQAEHDAMAQSILITTSETLATAVEKELESEAATLERHDIIRESLDGQGIVAIVDSVAEAITLANMYAPEHLCLYIDNSAAYVAQIEHAGCVFIGAHPSVVMGDYVAGPSHALPTSGTARFASPLNVGDFVRYMNVVDVNGRMMRDLGPAAVTLAEAEGLTAHARAAGGVKH